MFGKNRSDETSAKISLIVSMLIFGTIGVFRRYIPLSSTLIALVRGLIGTLFLLCVLKIKKQKISYKAFAKNSIYLILSGIFIGFNWILLFEAYNNTSVSIATLCYYMAPVVVIVLSPIFLKEKNGIKEWLSVIASVVGMIFISGVLNGSENGSFNPKGILFGLSAAVLYALVVLCNKKMTDISPYDKTIFQLALATIVLVPYTLFTESVSVNSVDMKTLILLLFVGVVHTGFTYYLYFGSMLNLSAQSIALYSYIDPICAIILSALFLKENFGINELIGTFLILGSTIIREISFSAAKK